MKRFVEFLICEDNVTPDGVKYIRNPGKSSIKRMLDKAHGEHGTPTLRYYYDVPSDSSYIWDAYDSTHGSFGFSMGLNWRPMDNSRTSLTGFITFDEYDQIKDTQASFKDWIKSRHERAKNNDWKGVYIPDPGEGYDTDDAWGTQSKSSTHVDRQPRHLALYPGEVRVSAHTRDGSQVHAYTRSRPSK